MHEQKRHIVLIITRLDRGGSAELTQQLAAGLVQRGYRVSLISGNTTEPAWDPRQYAIRNGFDLFFIKDLIRSVHPVCDLKVLGQLYRLLIHLRPDIVHSNSSKAGILGRLAARLAGVAHIIHSPHGHIFYGYYSAWVSRIFILLEKWVAHWTDKILNLTEIGRRDHIRAKIAPPQKFVVSYCGVDLEPFRSISQQKRPNHRLRICWIGRLVPIKNVQLLLKAAAILEQRDVHLCYQIIGDGEQRSETEQMAHSLQLTDISFLGYRQDIPKLLSQADIFVLTSLNEGFGRVIVEAMASGLPIVATRVGGVPELIRNGYNGYLVESEKAAELADVLEKLEKHPRTRKLFGQRNNKMAGFYSVHTYISRVTNVYSSLLAKDS